MINSLSVSNVGRFANDLEGNPASITFKTGTNLISSQPGLGKSLTLDMCWMLLTGTNPVERIVPMNNDKKSIIQNECNHFKWDAKKQSFAGVKKPSKNSIVVHAHRDGFSVWDWLRNLTLGNSPAGYHFSNNDVIKGTASTFNGMARDLASWSYDERLKPIVDHMLCLRNINLGEPSRMSVHDVTMMPSAMLDCGDVLLPRLPSSTKFDMSLIYLILWARFENIVASSMTKEEPANKLIILIDDADRHLSIDPCGEDNILGMNLRLYLDDISEIARASDEVSSSGNKIDIQIIATSKDYSLNGQLPTTPMADSEWRIEDKGSSVFVKVDTTTRHGC